MTRASNPAGTAGCSGNNPPGGQVALSVHTRKRPREGIVMRSFMLLGVTALTALLGGGFGIGPATADAPARHDILYTCGCGPDCSCKSASVKPGNCSCGKPMVWGHVVKIEGNDALVCTCAEGCTCKVDPKDPTMCGCGKTFKRVSLAGTGLYFCNCGGSCTCNTVSDTPGQCHCGMKLHQAEAEPATKG